MPFILELSMTQYPHYTLPQIIYVTQFATDFATEYFPIYDAEYQPADYVYQTIPHC